MARFWCGNNDPKLIDPALVDALATLDDTFFIFFETQFDDRNADITVLRASDDRAQPSTAIVTEVKHFAAPVRGSINGCWEREVTAGTWETLPSNGRDTSPYWQAVNTANAAANWLFSYQRFYLKDIDTLPSAGFRLWPDLLLLSPATVRHQLPLQTPNRFGFWFESIEKWVYHLDRWAPKHGLGFSADEITAMASTLQLIPYHPTMPSPVTAVPNQATLPKLSARLGQLETQLAGIQHELLALRSTLAGHVAA